MSGLNLDVNVLGHVLTTAQRLAIKNALYRTQLNEKLNHITFWGKIQGTQQDYFIAVSIQLGSNINKTFYWSCDNGVTFAKFSPIDEFISKIAPLITGFFTGNPTLKYKDPTKPKKLNEAGEEEEEEEETEQEEEQEQEEDGEVKKKPIERKLTELERLAFTVQSIDSETSIVPIGLSYLTPIGQILYDRTFTGLSVTAAKELESYAFFRDAETSETAARIRKLRGQNNYQYLDTVVPAYSKTNTSWSVHVDGSGLNVSLRSLLWLGYEYKVEAGSQQFGGGYFGWGEKNQDLHFMI